MRNRPKIGVLGDIMLDEYWFGDVNKISPEVPAPVLDVKSKEFRAGGAANVTMNLCKLNAKVSLYSIAGKDKNYSHLKKIFNNEINLTTKIDFERGYKTSKKLRLVSQNHQMMRVDFENAPKFSDVLIKRLSKDLNELDALIISDYGKGVLSKTLLVQLNKIIKEKKSNIKIFVDPNPKLTDYSIYKNSFFISPNKTEFEKAFGKFKDIKDLERKIRKAKKVLNIKNFVVTLGAKGMLLVDHLNNTHFFKALAKEVFDVSGAGDTVISSAAYFFSKDQCIKEAINKSNIAAAIVVGKFGTSIVSNNEIENFQSKHLSTKIVSQKELFLELKKINKKNIVVTNGCFDILHPGHLTYLKKAKDLGDIFIIAVNDNNSVSKLKGKNRPINNLNHRQKMLKLLDVADYVTSFSENNPHKLYSLIKPNIIVKGGDYKKEDVVGHDIVSKYSGKIEILPFEKGFSTSKIIKKISKN